MPPVFNNIIARIIQGIGSHGGIHFNDVFLMEYDRGPIPDRIPDANLLTPGVQNGRTVRVIVDPITKIEIEPVYPFLEKFLSSAKFGPLSRF